MAMAQETGMKLFFETAQQCAVFLLMVPVGILLALSVDVSSHMTGMKPMWDVLSMLLCFCTIGIGIVLLNDTGLRLYHVLAVVTGCILYTAGIRRSNGAKDQRAAGYAFEEKVFQWFCRIIKNRNNDEKQGRKSNIQVE